LKSDDERVLQRLGFPSIGRHRRFVTAIAVDAVGSGVFMPLAMLYFLAVTPLTLVQVGAAISIASAVALPVGPVIGGLVDRLGAKRVLLAGNLLQAVGYAAYLVTQSFAAVLVWTIVVTVGRTAFWGSYGNIVAAISLPGERETWFGFLGALRNVGFAVGGLAAGAAMTIGTDSAFAAVVAANAASYVAAFVLLLTVPETRPAHARALPGTWGTVLGDGRYRLLVGTQLGYSMAMMVLNFAIPVYAVTLLGLPGWLTGAVFTVNTVMVGFGQGLVVRGLTGRLRWRILVLTQLVFGASFVVLWAAGGAPAWLAVVLILVGSAVYTGGELLGGPVLAALSAEAAPAELRGRYLALIQLAWNIASAVAPVSFAWLLDRGAADLWVGLLGVSTLSVAAAVRLGTTMPHAARPVTNRAEPVPG
jgi:MFS family permease